MKKHKKLILFIGIIMLIIISWIFVPARFAWRPSQMPDIVFVKITDYSEVAKENEALYKIAFYDKNGNYYTSENEYVCSLPFDELIKEYKAGNLNNRITFHTTCDVKQLLKLHRKLCRLSSNRMLKMITPEYSLDVCAVENEWYGIYYDKFNHVQGLLYHQTNDGVDLETNSKRADRIFYLYEFNLKKE